MCSCDARVRDITCCAASSILPARASLVTVGCEAAGTKEPHPVGWSRKREPPWRLPASRGSGARMAWEGQQKCRADTRRDVRQAEDADTLEPQGKGSGTGVHASPVAEEASPAEKPALTRAGTQTKRGKPVILPAGEAHRKGRGWDGGYTRMEQAQAAVSCSREGCPHPPRKWADFPLVSRHEKRSGQDALSAG